MDEITFPTYHWKTKKYTGNVIMDYGFKCYYERITIYTQDSVTNKAGYPCVLIDELPNKRLVECIRKRYPYQHRLTLHLINYWIVTGKWTEENISRLDHKNHNKLDARLCNLEFGAWNSIAKTDHDGTKFAGNSNREEMYKRIRNS